MTSDRPIPLLRIALAVLLGAALAGCASFADGLSDGFSKGMSGAKTAVDAPTTVANLITAGVAAEPHPTTATTDPNHLLGRPNGYLSRATFTIPGVQGPSSDAESCDRGGCVEAWPDEAAAQARADYIGQIAKGLPGVVEYSYVRPDGLVLRVVKDATPEQVDKVKQAFLAS